MQDKACVGPVLEERFNWHTCQSEPLQDRKAFDEACQKYDEWLADEKQDQKNYPSPQCHRMKALAPLPTSTGEDPDFLVPSSKNASQRSRGGLISATSLQSKFQGDLNGHSSRIPTRPLACQQLSRAMRVFVAWKASSP